MTPNDIYALRHFEVKSIWRVLGSYACHIREFEDSNYLFDDDAMHDRIEVRVYFDPYIDGERCLTIGSVFFDGKPVMVFYHAGRGGHDEQDEYITDRKLYKEMVGYIMSLVKNPKVEPEDFDGNKPISNIMYGRIFCIKDGELQEASCEED